MLNKNHVAEIRTCQRIKFDQALYILTMYEKKIRVEVKFDENNQTIDAQKQYQEKIIRSWNGKWKMDLTKPLLNCVTSVSPRVVIDIPLDLQNQKKEADRQIDIYNRTMLKFIRRMRVEYQDEGNFKLTELNLNQKQQKVEINNEHSQKSLKRYIKAIKSMLVKMKESIKQNGKSLQIEEQEGCNYCFEILNRIEDMENTILSIQQNIQGGSKEKLIRFISTCLNIFENIKQSEHGATLITAQPQIEQFTYFLHPMFIAIYAYFLKQLDEQKQKGQKEKEKNKNKEKERSKKSEKKEDESQSQKCQFKEFFTTNTAGLSKIVFINLDGYESQFNLEFARCFRRNLMYISFPKQDIHYQNDNNSVYQQRLYKKIMYNWEKNKMRYRKSNSNMSQQSNLADKTYFLIHNIEDYFANVENTLYHFESGYQDINRNIFIFPLRLSTLNENFNNLIPEDEDDTIDVYQSYAILQIFKYYLVNQIKQFGATQIIFSHSGRLNIEDNHFVQIMQQLTKLSNYKLIMFPNLTTRFCSQKQGIDHQLILNGIDYLQRSQIIENEMREAQMQENPFHNEENSNLCFNFFNKIARFLKVSSGTHSLIKNFEQQNIVSKQRSLRVLRRINKLMEVMGNQYENMQRIRFKNSQIDLIPKLYQKDCQKIVKAFDKLVPIFYSQLYLLLQSILSVQYIPIDKNKGAINLLTKYSINHENVNNLYFLRELKFFIESKIIVRSGRNQEQNNIERFEKIKKYLDCQRQKHFLEISEEKYEDSALLYFKIAPNFALYDQTIDGKPNITGLIDVSFSNPNKDIKDNLNIFDSTQILYRVDQFRRNGPIPILIMNHLPLQRKSISKFDNYCAFLSRQVLEKTLSFKSPQQGIEKIYQQKRLKPYLIKLFDEQNRQIIQQRFQFRTQWNFCQTQNYIILFWPQLYNFVQAVSYKLQGLSYEPKILNQFFVAKKQVVNDAVCFYKTNVPDNLAPRSGCSPYEYRDKIYIFGGFYDQSLNYLELQRDISVINMDLYQHNENRKLQITNIKDTIYEKVTQGNDQKITPNSYVRTRRDYQFFDKSDIDPQYEDQGDIKTIIMLGGVGQNFLHPFSLLNYYFYELKFDTTNGRLQSIKKNIVYNRSIPANISKPSKNMGILKTAVRTKNQSNGKAIITKPQLTEPNSYGRMRVVYKIQSKQLKYRFQYVFSEKDCKMLKEQLRKYEEQGDNDQLVNIRIQKIEGMKHLFVIQKFGSKQIVHLRLDIMDSLQLKEQQFKLTNQSIAYLNIINGNYVFAIIKHPVFTNDRTILADCVVKCIENENLSDDEAPYVCLKPFYSELKADLTLHIIEASNMNLIYILHGHRLFQSNKIYEYFITHNKNKKTKIITQVKPKKIVGDFLDKQTPKCCYSTFFYKRTQQRNQIICESYLCFDQDQNIVTRINQYFDPSDSANMCWVSKGPIQKFAFCLKNQKRSINLERMTFLQFYRQQKLRILVIQYNRKKYIARILQNQIQSADGSIRIQLQLTSENQIRTLDDQQVEKGSILFKKPQFYSDRGYTRNKQ